MKFGFSWLVVALLLTGAVGCNSSRKFAWPFQGPPGTMQQQRLGATVHDPYADQEAGPEIVGGRPRDFQKALAEPVRSRPLWEGR